MAGQPAVLFKSVSRHFGEVKAVDGVDLAIQDGEFFSMLAPSGSGKPTCLRMIAGFDRPTSGQIFLYGQNVSQLPPYERSVNTVFQDYALFPHLTVAGNIAYGLMIKRVPQVQRSKQVEEICEAEDIVESPADNQKVTISRQAMKLARMARASNETSSEDFARALLKQEGDIHVARARLQIMRSLLHETEKYLTEG